jgi:RNA polymerase sigma-70 factor, ECF subfamily
LAEEVNRQFGSNLSKFFGFKLRNPNVADDALQETLLEVHRSAHKYDPSRPLFNWVCGIRQHVLLRIFERQRRHAMASLDALGSNGHSNGSERTLEVEDTRVRSPQSQAIANEDLEKLAGRIKALPQRLRLVTHRLLVERMSAAEIARKQNLSKSAINRRLAQAQNLLGFSMAGKGKSIRVSSKVKQQKNHISSPNAPHQAVPLPTPPIQMVVPIKHLEQISRHAAELARLLREFCVAA